MGPVPSTPCRSSVAQPQDMAEYLIGTFIGEKLFPLASDYWKKLLELPLNLHWPAQYVRQACKDQSVSSFQNVKCKLLHWERTKLVVAKGQIASTDPKSCGSPTYVLESMGKPHQG